MGKKTIVNILYVLAIISMLGGLFWDRENSFGLSFSPGLLFYAIGAIIADREKKAGESEK